MKKLLLIAIVFASVSFCIASETPKKELNISSLYGKNIQFNAQYQTAVYNPEVIAYIFVLHNDGCYYLGKVFLLEDGTLAWYNLYGDPSYVGTTVFCMNREVFDTFC